MNWTIEDWQWTQTPQGSAVVARAPTNPTAAQIGQLRKKCSQSQVGVAIESARAKAKAARKFEPSLAATIMGDCSGIEMSSSTASARYKAARFAQELEPESTILDLCCGIGGDSIQLALAGLHTIGVDRDETRAWMCAQNAKIETTVCDVLDPDLPAGAFHLDPSRRTDDGARSRRLEDLSPAPEIWKLIIAKRHHGAIKLHPGVHADELPAGEIEILSESGKLTQAVLWVGKLAKSARRATLLGKDGSVLAQLAGDPDRPTQESPIEQFIHTVDPSVERTDLMNELLAATSLSLVHPGTGLVTGSSASAHPMTTAFRVIDSMAWHHVKVREHLQSLNAGIVEIKTRGQIVDPDEMQRKLRGDGDRKLCVFILAIGKAVRAIMTERVPVP